MKKRSGFTLIELLVAITIFSIVIATISTVYVFFIREERNVAAVRKVYAEARDLMDRMTVSIKEGVPDYTFYNHITDVSDCASSTAPAENGRIATQTLVLLDTTGENRTVYCLSSDGDLYVGTGSVSDTVPLSLQKLSSDAVHFDYLDFLITPTADPSDPNNVNDDSVQYQPAVTISLKISGPSTQDHFTMPLTTTVSSRVYNR